MMMGCAAACCAVARADGGTCFAVLTTRTELETTSEVRAEMKPRIALRLSLAIEPSYLGTRELRKS